MGRACHDPVILFKLLAFASAATLIVLSLWSFSSHRSLMTMQSAKRFISTTCLHRLLGVLDAASAPHSMDFAEPRVVWLPQPTPTIPECIGPALLNASTGANQSHSFTKLELLTSADRSKIHSIVHQLHVNFSRLNAELFLVDGSLLGSVRHFGFIPWDADVDLMIRADQKPLVREFLVNLSALDEYQFQDTESTNQHYQLKILCSADHSKPSHNSKSCKSFIDFFFGRVDSENIFHRPEYPHTLPARDIYPLRLRPFGQFLLPSPRDPDSVLRRFLGSSDYMSRCHRKYVKSVTVTCDSLKSLYPFASHLHYLARKMQVEVLVVDPAILAVFIDPNKV